MPRFFGEIGLALRQPFAHNARVSHSCRRGALLFAIHALRVFTECHLQADGKANEHFIDRASASLNNRGLAAHQIARSGTGVDGSDAGLSQVLEGFIFGVNGINRSQMRHDRVGHLIAVGMIPTDAVGEHTSMAMGVYHAGNDVLASSVEHVGSGWNLYIGSYSRDLAVFNQNSSVDDGLFGGKNGGTLDCLHADSSSR